MNANINVGNLYHVFTELIIYPNENGETSISCQIYHPYIHQVQNSYEFLIMLTHFLGIFLGVPSCLYEIDFFLIIVEIK